MCIVQPHFMKMVIKIIIIKLNSNFDGQNACYKRTPEHFKKLKLKIEEKLKNNKSIVTVTTAFAIIR